MPGRGWAPDMVERAHRLGRYQRGGGGGRGNKPRPIIARMLRWGDVVQILGDREARDKMRKEGIHITQDYTRRQQGELQRLREQGKIAYFYRGRLFVKGEEERQQFRSDQNDSRRQQRDQRRGSWGRGYNRQGEESQRHYPTPRQAEGYDRDYRENGRRMTDNRKTGQYEERERRLDEGKQGIEGDRRHNKMEERGGQRENIRKEGTESDWKEKGLRQEGRKRRDSGEERRENGVEVLRWSDGVKEMENRQDGRRRASGEEVRERGVEGQRKSDGVNGRYESVEEMGGRNRNKENCEQKGTDEKEGEDMTTEQFNELRKKVANSQQMNYEDFIQMMKAWEKVNTSTQEAVRSGRMEGVKERLERMKIKDRGTNERERGREEDVEECREKRRERLGERKTDDDEDVEECVERGRERVRERERDDEEGRSEDEREDDGQGESLQDGREAMRSQECMDEREKWSGREAIATTEIEVINLTNEEAIVGAIANPEVNPEMKRKNNETKARGETIRVMKEGVVVGEVTEQDKEAKGVEEVTRGEVTKEVEDEDRPEESEIRQSGKGREVGVRGEDDKNEEEREEGEGEERERITIEGDGKTKQNERPWLTLAENEDDVAEIAEQKNQRSKQTEKNLNEPKPSYGGARPKTSRAKTLAEKKGGKEKGEEGEKEAGEGGGSFHSVQNEKKGSSGQASTRATVRKGQKGTSLGQSTIDKHFRGGRESGVGYGGGEMRGVGVGGSECNVGEDREKREKEKEEGGKIQRELRPRARSLLTAEKPRLTDRK